MSYRAIPRKPPRVPLRDWEFALNPPPAVGGAMLAAMLLAFGDRRLEHWGINMYFGGVAAAHFDGAGDFEVAADPRRAGGICVAGR